MERTGVHWDAVRAPTYLADLALDMLGEATGAVILDPYRGDRFWLLPLGSADTWELLPDVQTYGVACWIEVPPARRTSGRGPHWIVDPVAGSLLTHPAVLHAALSEAVATLHRPDPTASMKAKP